MSSIGARMCSGTNARHVPNVAMRAGDLSASQAPKGLARAAALVLALVLAGCSSMGGTGGASNAWSTKVANDTPMFPESKWGVAASPRVVEHSQPVRKGGGVYKVGAPYRVGDKWYEPREQPNYDRVGIASWYGSDFHGRKTANGEIYDMHALTAAHPTLPMPSYVHVTNMANGRTVLVRINDRGPYVAGRVIDLSKAAADALDLKGRGTGHVRVRYAGAAPLNGDDTRERQYLANGGEGPTRLAANALSQQTPPPWQSNTRVAALGSYSAPQPGYPQPPSTPPSQGWSGNQGYGQPPQQGFQPAPQGFQPAPQGYLPPQTAYAPAQSYPPPQFQPQPEAPQWTANSYRSSLGSKR